MGRITEDQQDILHRYEYVAERLFPRILRADSCIATTRIAIEVLTYFGLDVRPACVRLEVANAALMKLNERREAEGRADEPLTLDEHDAAKAEGAKLIVVGCYHEEPSSGKDDNGWPGHLVAIVYDSEDLTNSIIIDGSAGQASRPDAGIELPRVLRLPLLGGQKWFDGGQAIGGDDSENKLQVSYRYWQPQLQTYKQSPDWNRKWKRIVGWMIRRIRSVESLQEFRDEVKRLDSSLYDIIGRAQDNLQAATNFEEVNAAMKILISQSREMEKARRAHEREEQELIDMRVETGMLVCDVCTAPDPQWSAICAPFDLEAMGTVHQAEPDWALCDQCKACVERGDKDGLLQRGMSGASKQHKEFLRTDPAARQVLKLYLKQLQEKFWENFVHQILPLTDEMRAAYRKQHRQYRGGEMEQWK